jgi:hypothetical protein
MFDGRTVTQGIKPDSVRVATRADEEGLFRLLWEDLYADNKMTALLPPDEDRVRKHVEACCRGTAGIAGVIDGTEGIIGSIGLVWCYSWYSARGFIGETWLFVKPEHRKGTHHYRDLRRFALWHRQDLSDRTGIHIPLEISVYSFKRLAAKTRLWGQGARHAGSIFWIEGDK